MLETRLSYADAIPSRVPRAWLVIVAALVTAGRWWYSMDRHIFHLAPDEPAQLAVARWLAGRTAWNMFDHATWQPALAILIAPAYWVTDNGTDVVRYALFVNCLLGGIAAALLAVLVHRITNLGAWGSAVVAVLVGVAPASLSASSFVWAESLVSLTFLATTLALLRYYDTSSFTVGAGALAAAVAGYTVHSRLLPLIGTTLLLTVGREWWRHRWLRGAGLGVVAAALFAASAGWKQWVLDEVWEDPADQNTVGAVWKRAKQPLDVLDSILGQAWYQMAATFGLATIGAAIIAAACIRTGRIPTVAARIITITTVPLLVLSAIFMSDRPRADQFIYGRYNDAVMWPIIAVGMAWLANRFRFGFGRADRWLAGGAVVTLVGAGLAVDRMHGDLIQESYGVRAMIAGLLAYVDSTDTLHIWRVTLITAGLALLGLTFVVVANWAGPGRSGVVAVATALAMVLAVVGVQRTDEVGDLRLDGWESSKPVQEVEELVPEGVPLAVRTISSSEDPAVTWTTQRQRYQVYQFFLPDRVVLRDRGLDDDVGPYVFAPLGTEDLVEAGAELLWTDPSVKIGLWREPER
jgi:hypothetical protein